LTLDERIKILKIELKKPIMSKENIEDEEWT